MTHEQGRDHNRAETYNTGLHWLAIAVACAVFPLIIVGAGVTSKDAGMAYPDGFTSNGYLITNPPGWWDAEDTRWEHGHRILGRVAGILAIALAIMCWRRGGTIRVLGSVTLAGIVVQGVLGALRVNEISTTLAMIHGIFGQICFCVACAVALVTGPTFRRASSPIELPAADFLQRLCLVGVVAILTQLILGAAYRHFASDVTLFAHAIGAMVVTFLAGWIAMWVMGLASAGPTAVRLSMAIAGLMAVQLLLGGLAFTLVFMGVRWSGFLIWAVPSAHVAVGSLLLALQVALTLLVYRLFRPVPQPAGAHIAAWMTMP